MIWITLVDAFAGDILRLRSGQALSEVYGSSTFGRLHWSIVIISIAGEAPVRLKSRGNPFGLKISSDK
jgi:hypothetical protein